MKVDRCHKITGWRCVRSHHHRKQSHKETFALILQLQLQITSVNRMLKGQIGKSPQSQNRERD
ncbi:unnamed protein product [Arabidopsis halleri]